MLVPLLLPAAPNGEPAAGDQLAGLRAVFTRRRADLPRHAGEISFPGGRAEPQDPTLHATALREAHEEIGLAPADVTLVGELTPTSTVVSGYLIHPFVGVLAGEHAWRPSAREVAEVIELALADLRACATQTWIVRRGTRIRTYAYEVDSHFIWGATARILEGLIERIRPRCSTAAPSDEDASCWTGYEARGAARTLRADGRVGLVGQTFFSTGTPTRLPHSVHEPS